MLADIECTICDSGEDETPEHLIGYCNNLRDSRYLMLGNYELPGVYTDWAPHTLSEFLETNTIRALEAETFTLD